jgi:hypothetical protein
VQYDDQRKQFLHIPVLFGFEPAWFDSDVRIGKARLAAEQATNVESVPLYRATDGRCNTKIRQDERKSDRYPPTWAAAAKGLWQDSGIAFVFVSNASANVDFDVRLIHNGGSRGSGEKRPCVP